MTVLQAIRAATSKERVLKMEDRDGWIYVTLTYAPSMGAPYHVQGRVLEGKNDDFLIETVMRLTRDMDRAFPEPRHRLP